jgi:MYXO-CTERM domain-containing protein
MLGMLLAWDEALKHLSGGAPVMDAFKIYLMMALIGLIAAAAYRRRRAGAA